MLSLIGYWVGTYHLVKKCSKQQESQLSYHQHVFQFLGFFLATLLFFLVLWIISFVGTHFFATPFAYVNYETMWISTPLFVYVIGYFSLRQPEIFRIPFQKRSNVENNRLKPNEIRKLQKRLHFFMSQEKVFLQQDLTLKSLAGKLSTSSNNVSWLLNQVYQTSFYDYVNQHRIREFVSKIERQEHERHTLLALAMDVGYTSKSTFNKAFKNIMGVTPSHYIKNQKVA